MGSCQGQLRSKDFVRRDSQSLPANQPKRSRSASNFSVDKGPSRPVGRSVGTHAVYVKKENKPKLILPQNEAENEEENVERSIMRSPFRMFSGKTAFQENLESMLNDNSQPPKVYPRALLSQSKLKSMEPETRGTLSGPNYDSLDQFGSDVGGLHNSKGFSHFQLRELKKQESYFSKMNKSESPVKRTFMSNSIENSLNKRRTVNFDTSLGAAFKDSSKGGEESFALPTPKNTTTRPRKSCFRIKHQEVQPPDSRKHSPASITQVTQEDCSPDQVKHRLRSSQNLKTEKFDDSMGKTFSEIYPRDEGRKDSKNSFTMSIASPQIIKRNTIRGKSGFSKLRPMQSEEIQASDQSQIGPRNTSLNASKISPIRQKSLFNNSGFTNMMEEFTLKAMPAATESPEPLYLRKQRSSQEKVSKHFPLVIKQKKSKKPKPLETAMQNKLNLMIEKYGRERAKQARAAIFINDRQIDSAKF